MEIDGWVEVLGTTFRIGSYVMAESWVKHSKIEKKVGNVRPALKANKLLLKTEKGEKKTRLCTRVTVIIAVRKGIKRPIIRKMNTCKQPTKEMEKQKQRCRGRIRGSTCKQWCPKLLPRLQGEFKEFEDVIQGNKNVQGIDDDIISMLQDV